MNPANDPRHPARKHILIIDGLAEISTMVCELLHQEGYAVTTTRRGDDLWLEIVDLHPDLGIVQVVPRRDVEWQLLERLQQDPATIAMPVIVLSADPSLVDCAQRSSDRQGKHRFLAMPFDLDDLVRLVTALIGPAETRGTAR